MRERFICRDNKAGTEKNDDAVSASSLEEDPREFHGRALMAETRMTRRRMRTDYLKFLIVYCCFVSTAQKAVMTSSAVTLV